MNNGERFKNPFYVTYSNMTELMAQLTEEKQVEILCKDNSLNLNLLRNMLKTKMRGYNNTMIAGKLGVHRVTIQRYVETLRNLKESEFETIYNFLLKEENGTKN
jgi:response regulator of citrate/malate metabolism